GDEGDGPGSDGVLEGAGVVEEALAEGVVHGRAFRSARAVRRRRRTAVTRPPATTSARAAATTPLPGSAASEGCQAVGARPAYSAASVRTAMRCCLAIGPQNSCGAPAALPWART